MTPLKVLYIIILQLGIMYTALTLYFEHRKDKREKEWLKRQKHTHSLKKN